MWAGVVCHHDPGGVVVSAVFSVLDGKARVTATVLDAPVQTAARVEHETARCCWCGGKFWKSGAVWLCTTGACAKKQVAASVTVRAGKNGAPRAVYVPLPRQIDFHTCPAKNVLFGGAVAGTKSHALRWDGYLRCLTYPGFRALLLRRTLTELRDTHIDRIQMDKGLFGAEYFKSEYRLVFPNGSVLQLGHCEDADSYTRYLSTEYDAMYFDELVTFEEKPVLMMMSRARSTKPGVTPMVRAGTNPGGPGAHWIRRRWLDKNLTREESRGYVPEEWQYIPATLDDNPYIDAAYEARLDDLPEELRRAYRYGDWDMFPGQYFTIWRKAKHVSERHVVYAPDLPRVRVVDWGYVKPGVCLWIVLRPDGHAYVEEEYVFDRTIASDVAKEIRRRSVQRGLSRIRYTVGDTQMWAPESQTGEAIAETFGRLGVSMTQANKDRVNGWQRLQHWLQDAPDGVPWLTVSPDCPYTSRTLPSLVMDAHKPEDVDSDGEDHAADALRYFCMSRPSPVQDRAVETYPPGTIGHLRRWKVPPLPCLGSEAVKR